MTRSVIILTVFTDAGIKYLKGKITPPTIQDTSIYSTDFLYPSYSTFVTTLTNTIKCIPPVLTVCTDCFTIDLSLDFLYSLTQYTYRPSLRRPRLPFHLRYRDLVPSQTVDVLSCLSVPWTSQTLTSVDSLVPLLPLSTQSFCRPSVSLLSLK